MKDIKVHFAPGKSQLSPYVEIYRDCIYERDSRFLPQPGDTIFDVGAHIGFFSLRQAARLSSGMVFAFEPKPDTFRLLLNNIAANGLANVRAMNCAVASRDGLVTLRIASGSSQGNTIMQDGTVGDYSECVSVQARTLDSVVQEFRVQTIHLLKIDVEGAEVEVLNGAMSCALPITYRCVIETHSSDLRRQVKLILEPLGFDTVLETPSGHNALGENTLVYFLRK